MLSRLRIRNLGVIHEATLSLSSGFSVLTGETGAGKTMVLSSVDLLFGQRADPAQVRSGAQKAMIEGWITPPHDRELLSGLSALGVELPEDCDEDGKLAVSRSVNHSGRSRGHAAGRSSPIGFLSEIGAYLLTVHGQAEQHTLTSAAQQRSRVDAYASAAITPLLEKYRQVWSEWSEVSSQLRERTLHARERAQEADLLRFGISEISALDPQPGEEEELRRQIERLSHAEELQYAAAIAHAALAGDTELEQGADISTLLGTVRAELARVAEHDEQLEKLHARAEELAALSSELASDVAAYGEEVESDPAALAHAQERTHALGGLLRKYADTLEGVSAWRIDAEKRLSELDDSDELLAELRERLDALTQQLTEAAGALSQARRTAADQLSGAVSSELAGLAMPHTKLVTQVTLAPVRDGLPVIEVGGENTTPGPDGVDIVEFQLHHAGSRPLPLAKAASGGELSRVMLALEVVLATDAGPPTMIFDEIDAGVGGKAAVEIGYRLSQLARSKQVLVVTHLPQVAAFADHHIVIEKDHDGNITTAQVREVADEQRVRELARMLAGLENSERGLAHAEELLGVARKRRMT